MKEILTVAVLSAFAFLAWCIESLIDGRKFERVEILVITALVLCVLFLIGALALHFGRF